MRLELEEISDDEYKAGEAELFGRLRRIKEQQMEVLHQAVITVDPLKPTIDVAFKLAYHVCSMTELALKLTIIISTVGLLRTSKRFQSMSRDFDESALTAMKRMMGAAEESGLPPETVPLLMLVTVLAFAISGYLTGVFGL